MYRHLETENVWQLKENHLKYIHSLFIGEKIWKNFLQPVWLFCLLQRLAACSGKTASESSSKDAKASSSKVEKSSTSESKSSSSSKSSKSATSSVEIPEIVLLTDEEIDNAKTLGDMKTIYGKMIDNYTKYVKEIGDKIPASGKDAYNKQVDPAIQSMETCKKNI